MPVSKTHPPSVILAAAQASGIRLFGENKVQEMVAKQAELPPDSGVSWALIGHLQTNKTKLAVEVASEFHALDRLKLAATLDRHLSAAGRSLDVFVQVNSSGEDSKFGLPPDDVLAFCAELAAFDTLRVRGLMTLAVFSEDHEQVAACFERMRTLQHHLQDAGALGNDWHELSMGMTGDFELAIEYGATTVRVGQAIFGTRLRPQDYWPPQN